MDREISTNVVQQKKRKNGLYAVLAIAGIAAAVILLRGSLSTDLKRSDIRVAVVEVGSIENTLTAAGELLPEFEQVITSPITAVLQQVYLNEGSVVKLGDKILELDKEFTKLDFEKQRDQLELKKNGVVKMGLDLDKSAYDLKINDSIKAFKINALQADVENAKRLFKAGGGTREAIEQAENNLKIAQLEKRQLENDIRSRQAATQASIRETQITASIQEKELRAFERKLQQANIVATRSGVLTFVNKNLGVKVGEGEILARIADLGSFKVQGTISDNYAQQVRIGMPILIKLNDTIVSATLSNIAPSVANNILAFDATLDIKSNAAFRPKMKVEVFLITDSRAKTLRVANGAAFKTGSNQTVFVLRPDGKAERRNIKTGLVSFDFIEITEGVQKGESVIISDLSAYKNVDVIEIKN
jgi:HlyD family secretion protein